MQLQEFCKATVEKPSTVWECTTCGLIKIMELNPATVVCPECKQNMTRKEELI